MIRRSAAATSPREPRRRARTGRQACHSRRFRISTSLNPSRLPPSSDGRAPELATGKITLDKALQRVDVGISPPLSVRPKACQNGSVGSLQVIPSRAPVSDPAWIAANSFSSILGQMQQRSDLVIVHGSPRLLTGDAVETSARVDAILMVTRLNHIRRPRLKSSRASCGSRQRSSSVSSPPTPIPSLATGTLRVRTICRRPLRRSRPCDGLACSAPVMTGSLGSGNRP
jgi:hypothetical protein